MNNSSNPLYFIELIEAAVNYHSGKVVPVSSDKICIGRGAGNEIQYGDDRPNVSRKHCNLLFSKGQVSVFPLHKHDNSTFINGRKILDVSVLKNGDKLTLANNGPTIKLINERYRGERIVKYGFIDVAIILLGLISVILIYFISKKLM